MAWWNTSSGDAGRPGDVVVDSPQGHRVEDRLGARRVCPGSRRDEQRTLGVRMELPRSLEATRRRSHPERLPASTSATSSPAWASSAISTEAPAPARSGFRPVVTGVALDELSLDVFEDVLVFVDDEKDGERHLVAQRIKADGAQRSENTRALLQLMPAPASS